MQQVVDRREGSSSAAAGRFKRTPKQKVRARMKRETLLEIERKVLYSGSLMLEVGDRAQLVQKQAVVGRKGVVM